MRKLFVFIYLYYLKLFAKIQLKKINPVIIGVGGSSGKTSTAYLLGKVLALKYELKESNGKNSEVGIPLSILGIDIKKYSILEWIKILFIVPLKLVTNKKYEIYIAEMGIDSFKFPKNMKYLLSILKPKIAVLTNIDIEHSQNFEVEITEKDEAKRRETILKKIASQENLLLKSVAIDGVSIINLDDENISGALPLKSKIITISLFDKNADFYADQVEVLEDRFYMRFTFLKEKYSLTISRALPKFYAYSFLSVLAISFNCKININDAIRLIEKDFSIPPGRFSVFKGIKNTTIVDSSYNSTLVAAIGAIETINIMANKRRRVAVLGDMRELGSISKIQHEKLASLILKNLDFVILIGPILSNYIAPILERNNFKYKKFEDFKASKEGIINEINDRDIILVKGSQNELFLERVTKMLLLNNNDEKMLPRRGEFWDIKRKKSN